MRLNQSSVKTPVPSLKEKNNITPISLNMTCATVGLVIIFIPKLFLETGFILGTLMLVISGILSFITCLMLCQASMTFGAKSFPELCRKIMGKYSLIVEFFFALNLLGNIIGNHTFISKSVSGMLSHLFFPSISVGSQQETYFTILTMFVMTLAIVPYIISKDISSLKKISTYSALGYVIAMFAVITLFLFPSLYGVERPPLSFEKMELLNWEGLTTATGMFFLAMAVHVVVIDIHSQLKPLNEVNTFKLFTVAHRNSFLIFYTIGLLGFLCVYQDPQASSLNIFYLFFLVHKKIHSSVLRLTQIGLTFCIGIGNIFAYLPLIKIIENIIKMIYKEELEKNRENEKQMELPDVEKSSMAGNNTMISQHSTDISAFESKDEIDKTPSNEKIMVFEDEGYNSRIQKKLSKNSLEEANVSNVPIQEILTTMKITQGETLYKKIALYLQGTIILMLFFIIKNKISLYVVFNIVSAICYPTICLIFPSLFFMVSIKKKRELTTEEKGICYGIVLIGIGVLFFMVINLFD
jgi:amino acid permease